MQKGRTLKATVSEQLKQLKLIIQMEISVLRTIIWSKNYDHHNGCHDRCYNGCCDGCPAESGDLITDGQIKYVAA